MYLKTIWTGKQTSKTFEIYYFIEQVLLVNNYSLMKLLSSSRQSNKFCLFIDCVFDCICFQKMYKNCKKCRHFLHLFFLHCKIIIMYSLVEGNFLINIVLPQSNPFVLLICGLSFELRDGLATTPKTSNGDITSECQKKQKSCKCKANPNHSENTFHKFVAQLDAGDGNLLCLSRLLGLSILFYWAQPFSRPNKKLGTTIWLSVYMLHLSSKFEQIFFMHSTSCVKCIFDVDFTSY